MNVTKTNERTAENQGYIRLFDTEDEAERHMRGRNRFRALGMRNHSGAMFVLVEGPDDNYAVVDIATAIEMDVPYRWAV